MFFNNNEDKNKEFNLNGFIADITETMERYGIVENLKIEVLNHLDKVSIELNLDYGE